jgi:outer membrane protein assembly factor BamA
LHQRLRGLHVALWGRVRSLILLTVVAAAVAAVVVHQLPEGEAAAEVTTRAQEVQSIAFDGQHLPTALLRSQLATHAGALLDGATLDRDRSALEHALTERGYLAAHVEPALVTFDAGGGAYITFAVVQGPLFHLRTVTVTGTRDAGIVTLAQGDVAEADRLERARQMLADTLSRRGKTAVTVELTKDVRAGAVDVVLAAR